MELKQFITDLEDAIEDVEAGTLTADTEYKSLATWDSLAVLTVSGAVELEYGVLLRKDDFAQCKTVEALYELVSSRQRT